MKEWESGRELYEEIGEMQEQENTRIGNKTMYLTLILWRKMLKEMGQMMFVRKKSIWFGRMYIINSSFVL